MAAAGTGKGRAQSHIPEAELFKFRFRRLLFQLRKVDGFIQNTGRGAGFQPAEFDSELIAQSIREFA
jgi:hypothetical protein